VTTLPRLVFAQAHAGGDTNAPAHDQSQARVRRGGHTKMQLSRQLIILRSAPGNPSLSHYKYKTAKLSDESNHVFHTTFDTRGNFERGRYDH